MKLDSDIDIDLGSRDVLLEHIRHIPASMRNVNPIRKHSTGVHVTDIPYDPVNNMASIDYKEAEDRGYFKLDLLNVHVYTDVKSEEHLLTLMREPDWDLLKNREFVQEIVHIGNHYDSLRKMPEPVDSIPRLAMFLAVIRPGKKHLIGKTWKEVAQTVWDREADGYMFKKAHAVSYSHLVVVHMNLKVESRHSTNQSDGAAFHSSFV